MHKLFTIQPSNFHQSLLPREIGEWLPATKSINRTRLLPEWRTLEFELRSLDKRSTKRPSISIIYVLGVIAFRADLKLAIFPFDEDDLEFLPISVSGEQWLVMNCLRTVREFDEYKSRIQRGLNGEIYMVLNICVTDPAALNCEIFTVADSNRGQLIIQSSLKDRIEKLQIEGIKFTQIGELVLKP